jgi:salicylate hydroxylase
MTLRLLIAGAGLGGLAAAIAAQRAGASARVCEQAPELLEVGAGLQLGPNATRVLENWGLLPALLEAAALPAMLKVRSADDGRVLGQIALGDDALRRYGAPYATVHRADLQAILHAAARKEGAAIETDSPILDLDASHDAVSVQLDGGSRIEADALVGADGLWSTVRAQALGESGPAATGHMAFRGLVAQSDLPTALRSGDVTVWLAHGLHAVAYPVRGGEALNLVAIVDAGQRPDFRDWDAVASAQDVGAAVGAVCAPLRGLLDAMPAWRLWMLHDRPPLRGAHEMALGRVALLGDAAHPMRPYLAQGAGMAIEDAAVLGDVLAGAESGTVAAAWRTYALRRWERCARVQAQSRRNGTVFHASGPLRWGRDAVMWLLGDRLLDQPWLYGWRPDAAGDSQVGA